MVKMVLNVVTKVLAIQSLNMVEKVLGIKHVTNVLQWGASCSDEDYCCKPLVSIEGGEKMDTSKFTSTNIPVTFQKMSEFDSRFMSVKIWLLHLGENYNGSYFTREAVERAIPSLANTPILGFVKENQIGKEDFAGHEMEIEVRNGEYVQKYLGQAFGVIPETNNARWDKRAGDDGVVRDYLVVDGLLWNKLQDGTNIMERDEVKGQSMELHTDYTGHFNQEGLFVFDHFSFYGACILGDSTHPAMQRSTIEKFTKKNKMLEEEIANKLREFQNLFAKEEKKLDYEAIMKEFNITDEWLAEKGVKKEDFSVDEFKEEIKRILDEEKKKQDQDKGSNQNDDTNHQKEDDNKKQQGDGDDDKSQDQKDDEQSSQTDKQDLGEDFEKSKQQQNAKEDEKTSKKTNENNSLSDLEKQVEDLKKELQTLETSFSTLKTERDTLATYKANKEKEDHQSQVESLIASFEKLEEADVKEIRDNMFDLTLEQIEDKLFSILGRKTANFSTKKKQEFTKMPLDKNEKDKKPNEKPYDYLFSKHLKK
jgi:hypothetical protein